MMNQWISECHIFGQTHAQMTNQFRPGASRRRLQGSCSEFSLVAIDLGSSFHIFSTRNTPKLGDLINLILLILHLHSSIAMVVVGDTPIISIHLLRFRPGTRAPAPAPVAPAAAAAAAAPTGATRSRPPWRAWRRLRCRPWPGWRPWR